MRSTTSAAGGPVERHRAVRRYGTVERAIQRCGELCVRLRCAQEVYRKYIARRCFCTLYGSWSASSRTYRARASGSTPTVRATPGRKLPKGRGTCPHPPPAPRPRPWCTERMLTTIRTRMHYCRTKKHRQCLYCRAMEASHAHAGTACCGGVAVGTKSLVGSLGSTYAACTSIAAMFNADGACAG